MPINTKNNTNNDEKAYQQQILSPSLIRTCLMLSHTKTFINYPVFYHNDLILHIYHTNMHKMLHILSSYSYNNNIAHLWLLVYTIIIIIILKCACYKFCICNRKIMNMYYVAHICLICNYYIHRLLGFMVSVVKYGTTINCGVYVVESRLHKYLNLW